jgi:hypothetical protein
MKQFTITYYNSINGDKEWINTRGLSKNSVKEIFIKNHSSFSILKIEEL